MSPLNSCVDIAGPTVVVVGIDVVLVVGRHRNRVVGPRATITVVGRMRQVRSRVTIVAAMAVAVAVSMSIARVANMTITGVGAVYAILVTITAAVAVRRRNRVEHCGGMVVVVAGGVVVMSFLRGFV